ncbi:hypothetical protein RE6C_03745 [Rhodopirellula europaea 6C]|uniref:Uncharacterized protein n=1 Tax=Rhodopirellula europaea 6C TaxID=1263867 RepID=M2A5K2_9BACT|nr:hypothetical protein RE6C_03745 [Rhodopirellula europaea 6C]
MWSLVQRSKCLVGLVLFAFDESGRLLLVNFLEAKFIDDLNRIVNRYGGPEPS